MPENTRVKISSVVKNQLPDFIKADFPLAGEFLAQYYTALEGQGSTLDVLQNIDKYIKIDELTDLIDSTSLSTNVGIADNISSGDNTSGTLYTATSSYVAGDIARLTEDERANTSLLSSDTYVLGSSNMPQAAPQY